MDLAGDGRGTMVIGLEWGRGKGKEGRTLSFISVLDQSILIRLVESHIDSLCLLFWTVSSVNSQSKHLLVYEMKEDE